MKTYIVSGLVCEMYVKTVTVHADSEWDANLKAREFGLTQIISVKEEKNE
jgi:hypothetical protein